MECGSGLLKFMEKQELEKYAYKEGVVLKVMEMTNRCFVEMMKAGVSAEGSALVRSVLQ